MAGITEGKSAWEIIQGAPALASAVAGLSLVVSVAYELGYTSAIDARLITLFSIQDSITIALHFVPLMALSIGVAEVVTRVFPRAPVNADVRCRRDQTRQWICTFIALCGLILLIFTTERFLAIVFLVGAGPLAFINPRTRTRSERWAAVLIFLIFSAFAAGGQRATDELHSEKTPFKIDGTPYQILIAGAELLVVRDTPGHVAVLSRSEVKRIETVVSEVKPWVDLRRWFKRAAAPTKMEPAFDPKVQESAPAPTGSTP